MTAEAFPLQWPAAAPACGLEPARTAVTHLEAVGRAVAMMAAIVRQRRSLLMKARKKLCAEMDRLGAKSLVISTNLPLRNDGYPRADAARMRIADPGVAIYFTLKGLQMAMACDRYDAPSANLRSLGLGIEAMRQLERHGGGAMMERAFAAFAASCRRAASGHGGTSSGSATSPSRAKPCSRSTVCSPRSSIPTRAARKPRCPNSTSPAMTRCGSSAHDHGCGPHP